MSIITFYNADKTMFVCVEKTKKRWKLKASFKNGSVDKNNLTEESMWGGVRSVFDKDFKMPKDKTALGVEWAAIRMAGGSKPLIIPLARGGNWLYVERKGTDEYEIRIVEPLGSKRTKAQRVNKATATGIIQQASKRTYREQREELQTANT